MSATTSGVPYGMFKMIAPRRSVQGQFLLLGAIVGGVGVYPKRLPLTAKIDDVRRAFGALREQIHKEHPGIKEQFTRIRPATNFN